jgi:hypothetical protein
MRLHDRCLAATPGDQALLLEQRDRRTRGAQRGVPALAEFLQCGQRVPGGEVSPFDLHPEIVSDP